VLSTLMCESNHFQGKWKSKNDGDAF